MQINVDSLKYDEARHLGHTPENAEEKLVWTVLDAVDELFTVIAAELVIGGVSEERKAAVPPGPVKSREALAGALASYVRETTALMEELDSLGDLFHRD